MNYKLPKKELSFLLKHQLLSFDKDEIYEIYKDRNQYLEFLRSINQLIIDDPCFLVLEDKNIDKIQYVINKERFENKTVKDLTPIQNELIVKLNVLKNLNKETIIPRYIDQQMIGRGCIAMTKTALIKQIAHDYYLIHSLKEDTLENLEPSNFMCSTFYLLEEYPEMYKEHPEYLQETIDYVNKIKQQNESENETLYNFSKKLNKELVKRGKVINN